MAEAAGPVKVGRTQRPGTTRQRGSRRKGLTA
jgi:hypothetical protein